MKTRLHGETWLEALLQENENCLYLRGFSSPRHLSEFTKRVPFTGYDGLTGYIDDIARGRADILFSGRPVAFERTGGSSGGSKLIPYSKSGMLDFRKALSSCLRHVLKKFEITGQVYLSTSPVTRPSQHLSGVPVGIADADYLDPEMGKFVFEHSAVPFDVSTIKKIDQWKEETLSYLSRADNLQFISVWSPSFLISLFREMHDPARFLPDLRAISCWSSGSSELYADQLRQMFPGAEIVPKGLMSTEAVVTYNDVDGSTVLNRHGFYEFIAETGEALLVEELIPSCAYEVVITTASGLYRYKTGDRVIYRGVNALGSHAFDFTGRSGVVSDLVGEKIDEAFVAEIFKRLHIDGFMFPDSEARHYSLLTGKPLSAKEMQEIESSLCANPQYAYARKLGQLQGLKNVVVARFQAIVEGELLRRGFRLGDIKPLALRKEFFWESVFDAKRTAA